MDRKLTWYDAIKARTSRRDYTGVPLGADQAAAIRRLISDINAESGLRFNLLEDVNKFFAGFKASYGMLRNVTSAVALIGNKELPHVETLVGYYGEFLVLECVNLNLGTCWVGGTYDKEVLKKSLSLMDNEELFLVFTVGDVDVKKSLKEIAISSIGKTKQTFAELLREKEDPLPLWVSSGIEAARLAPSAMNKKPVGYSYVDQTLKAYITKPNHPYKDVDLGISLAHFELGALHEGVKGEWHPQDPTVLSKNIGFIFEPN